MNKHWVIPDIHGCSNTLKALVEEQIRPTKHDSIGSVKVLLQLVKLVVLPEARPGLVLEPEL